MWPHCPAEWDQESEKIPVPGLEMPSQPLPLPSRPMSCMTCCRIMSMQCNLINICLCYRSIFLFSAVGCSFPKSLSSAKIDLVIGSVSGYRPGTHVLKGALGFWTSPFAVNSSQQNNLNGIAVTGQIHCFSLGLSTFLCLTLTAFLLAQTLVKFLH